MESEFADEILPKLQRLRELKQDSVRLKRMYAHLALDHAAVHHVLRRML